jgi:ComF family protein
MESILSKPRQMMILDFIFPNACLVCRSIDIDNQTNFCIECWKNLTFIQKPQCDICGLPFSFSETPTPCREILCKNCIVEKPFFTKARSIFIYNDTIRKALLTFKNQDQTQYAKFFSKILESYIASQKLKFDLIIPIPLHWTRLFKRQFNQSALITNHLGKNLKSTVHYDILKRIKKTSFQYEKSRIQRFLNLKDSFSIKNNEYIYRKKILLIDDVMTTGSTLNEASKALTAGDPDEIYCLSIARSVPGFT